MLLKRAIRPVTARPRLLSAAVLFAVVAWFEPGTMRGLTWLLVAWDVGVLLYLALVAAMAIRSDNAAIQRRADEEDAGAAAVLILTMAAAAASFIAIGAELHGLKDGKSFEGLRLGLAGATILLSWIFVHTMFALHYAHDYYAGADDRGGLDFPHDKTPDYWDFAYFAFTMGAASQTSDVAVTAKRMRRFVLAHTVLSFLFNTTVLALGVNVGASLL
jgi:uncharacterized membrane protein